MCVALRRPCLTLKSNAEVFRREIDSAEPDRPPTDLSFVHNP